MPIKFSVMMHLTQVKQTGKSEGEVGFSAGKFPFVVRLGLRTTVTLIVSDRTKESHKQTTEPMGVETEGRASVLKRKTSSMETLF